MKKLTKWLALLLAGVLTVSTMLVACNDAGAGGDLDDEEKEEKEENLDAYMGFSPEEAYEEMLDVKDVTVVGKYLSGDNQREITIKRDGDKAKVTVEVIFEDGDSEDTTDRYYDFDEGVEYLQDDDGEWYTEALEDYGWEELVAFDDDTKAILFSDDSYGEADDGRYEMIDESVAAYFEGMFGDLTDYTLSGYMTSKKATYTYLVKAIDADDVEESFEFKIKFGSVSVKLPKVEESERPAQPVATTTRPVESAPIVTPAPPAVTVPPATMPDPMPEAPMESWEVEEWMNEHTCVNRLIDPYSYFSDGAMIFPDTPMENLFDDVYTAEDAWYEESKMAFMNTPAAFYWSMTEPVELNSYVIYTGDTSAVWTGRNPVGWKLYATNDEYLMMNSAGLSGDEMIDAGWALLDDVFEGNLQDANSQPFGYVIDEYARGAYMYYCWVVDYSSTMDGVIQVNGMRLYADGWYELPTDPYAPENPLSDMDVQYWMDSHTLLNDSIDRNSLYSSQVGFFADGGLGNLFDDVFTVEEWLLAMDEGRFDEAITHRWDTNGDGIIDENDIVIDLGKMGFVGTTGAFYWSMTEQVTLGSYVIYTGNDNSTHPNRNPVGWKLYGTNDPALGAVPADLDNRGCSATALDNADELEAAGWVLLDDVFDGNMADADAMPYGYLIDEDKQGAYQYYCWFIDYGEIEASEIQVNGMKLFAAD